MYFKILSLNDSFRKKNPFNLYAKTIRLHSAMWSKRHLLGQTHSSHKLPRLNWWNLLKYETGPSSTEGSFCNGYVPVFTSFCYCLNPTNNTFAFVHNIPVVFFTLHTNCLKNKRTMDKTHNKYQKSPKNIDWYSTTCMDIENQRWVNGRIE